VQLLATWTAANLEHIRRHKRLVADHRGALDRHIIGRIVARAARAAGVSGAHPHRLRHTLATQAKMSRVAFDATFGRSRKRALPAVQRAALGQARSHRSPYILRDLGCHHPLASGRTMMQPVRLQRIPV
jgi:hypothetical protein